MNKELLLFFLNENWVLFAALFLSSIMAYVSFVSGRFSALSPEQAIRFINDGAWVVDTREIEEFRKGHIDGSSNLPSSSIGNEIEAQFARQKKPKNVLIYCLNGTGSIPTIKKLKPLSLETSLHYIQGGLQAWKAAQYPISKLTKESKMKATKK